MKLKTQEFYYKFNKLNAWFILNVVLFNVLVYWGIVCPCLVFWWQTQVLIGVCVISWGVWSYKYLKKHRMALVDDESIVIDNCKPLNWKDIKSAEEKTMRCGLKKYHIIVLNPKENTKYEYNWLQKHNCDFGAFSIPLYGILSKKDEESLIKIVKSKVKNFTEN